jgi:hydroxyethylthiazole kinase
MKALLTTLKERAPLVHNITNYVVMEFNANVLLALGASPVMAHAYEEVEDMVSLAGALVVNMGTLSPAWVESMVLAMRQARHLGKPIVFDPVGVGATKYRTQVARRLLSEGRPTVVRGNASEILALHQSLGVTKGVDSVNTSDEALAAARALAERDGCVVCVSGAVDYVVSSQRLTAIRNGHPLMTRVTGVGCAATAVIGAFSAVAPSPFDATVAAMTTMGVAGELAAEISRGPGSFQSALLDALYLLDSDQLERAARVEAL